MDNTPIQPEEKFADSINPSETQVIKEQIDQPKQKKNKSEKSLNLPKIENSSIRVGVLDDHVENSSKEEVNNLLQKRKKSAETVKNE